MFKHTGGENIDAIVYQPAVSSMTSQKRKFSICRKWSTNHAKLKPLGWNVAALEATLL